MKNIFLLAVAVLVPNLFLGFASAQQNACTTNDDCYVYNGGSNANDPQCRSGYLCVSGPMPAPGYKLKGICVSQSNSLDCSSFYPASANGVGFPTGQIPISQSVRAEGDVPCSYAFASARAVSATTRSAASRATLGSQYGRARFGSSAPPAVRVNLPRMRCGRSGQTPYYCPAATPTCCNDPQATNGDYIGTCVAPYAACPTPRPHPNPNPQPRAVCTPRCGAGEACVRCKPSHTPNQGVCVDVRGGGPITIPSCP